MLEASLIRFLNLKPAELYIQVQVRIVTSGVRLWLAKEEEVFMTEDTIKGAFFPIPGKIIFS